MRVRVTLACQECKNRNYNTTKNKRMIRIGLNLRNIVNSVRNTLFTKKLNNEKGVMNWQSKINRIWAAAQIKLQAMNKKKIFRPGCK